MARSNRDYKNSSESNEWYTPAKYIEAARGVMGGIDLDPASNEQANKTIQASRIYTIKDNALVQTWSGRVWLNPPYGNDVEPFVDKLLASVASGDVTEAILLVAARTDTAWFRKLREYPRCFIWGRIKFISGETLEPGDPAGFPSMAVYFGPAGKQWQFARTFSKLGDIYALREMGSMSKGLSKLQKNILIMANRHRTSALRAKDSELSTIHGGLFGADLKTEQVITAVYGTPSNAARAAISRAFCRLEQRGLATRVFGRYWAGINLTQEGIDTAVSVDKSEVIP